MKNTFMRSFSGLLTLTFILVLFTCEKNDPLIDDDVTGTYIGTLSTDILGRSNDDATNINATADIQLIGSQIQVHCYAQDFNETALLDIFHDNGIIRVCLTGEDFENMYGHAYGHGHMGNGNGAQGGNEWMRHLNNHHQEGDEHYGYFDLQSHTFDYTFQMGNGDFHFQGVKN